MPKVPLAALLVAVFLPASAFAQVPPAQQRQIERQLDQIQQLQQQQFDQRARERWQSEHPPAPLPLQPEAAPSAPAAVCFNLRTIVFEGAEHLSERDRAELSAPYVGRCVTFADVNQLIRAVTDLYGERGYVTTRATLPKQDVSGGTLRVRVVEGRVQGFQLNGQPADHRSEVAAAFPMDPGDTLNLRDIEQGLDQLNRLRSNDARLQLIPGDAEGDSIIAIDNRPKKRWRVSAGADNSGQRTTGELQFKQSGEIDNLLGVDDYFGLTHSRDTLGNSSERTSQSWAFNGSIPYGAWRVNAGVNLFDYRSVVYQTSPGQSQAFPLNGSQRAYFLSVDRLLHRDGDGKTFANLSLTRKNIANAVAGVQTDGSSPKLVIAGLSLDHVRRVEDGVLHATVQYSGGLHALGARDDRLWPNAPKAQFTRWLGDLSYARPFSLFGLQPTLSGTAHGQWTNDSLYSTEQIALGSESSVRGYKTEVLQGSRGGYLRTELAVPLPTGIGQVDDALGAITPFVAYDVGVIARFRPETAVPGRLSGAAAGLRLGGTWLEGQLTCAWPLGHPATIAPPPRQITFSLALVL